MDLETKFCTAPGDMTLDDGLTLRGYASLFGQADHGADVVAPGAFARSLKALEASGNRLKMLWQHDPAQPIGVWHIAREDALGLYVEGRLLPDVARGAEAAALLGAGAIDGLSIGYRTKTAERLASGGRKLTDVDLWEVSLVTFPMLAEARVAGKSTTPGGDEVRALTQAFKEAQQALKRARPCPSQN